MVVNVATNRYSVARYIVAPTIAEGANFTTITAALAAASSGETIFIRPGTYTEDLTLKADVNLSSFSGEGVTPTVTIIGKLTATFAGTAVITGIRLQTHGDNFLAITGSAATRINLWNCYTNCTDATGISISSSSANSRLELNYCRGDIAASGIALFNFTGAGSISPYYSNFGNSGQSTTDSTISSGIYEAEYCVFGFGITTSGTASYSSLYSTYSPAGHGLNHTALNAGSVGNHGTSHDIYSSGSATAIVINNGALIIGQAVISCTNTNAISGTGSIFYDGLSFFGGSQKISVSTQTGGLLRGGQTQNPSLGFIGERIEASAGLASVAMVNNTAKTVTSISLTAGIWDLYSLCAVSGVLTGTRFQTSISATNNALGAGGIGGDTTDGPTMPNAAANVTHTIAGIRVMVTATTTYYLVGRVSFTGGTATCGGSLRATRVG